MGRLSWIIQMCPVQSQGSLKVEARGRRRGSQLAGVRKTRWVIAGFGDTRDHNPKNTGSL